MKLQNIQTSEMYAEMYAAVYDIQTSEMYAEMYAAVYDIQTSEMYAVAIIGQLIWS